ncbi:uncharacterized protein SAPINGB_P002774 [Magnusiomyces paraingens]|uniref:chitin synthase n=1 Tax=Magnusiomyces paraingens TaxID=2606893 RepID=A0A5E8BFZ5_9ASCO|nr:uncharacterized protein SAPINGB_P002774 [Saprochaete ingens]VVT50470.1 unnamed protein product [Saprochaete ingens]
MDPNNPNNNNSFDPNAQNNNYNEYPGQDDQQQQQQQQQHQQHDDYVHQLEQQQHEEMLREQQQEQQQFSTTTTPTPLPPQPPLPVQHHDTPTPYPDTEYRTPYPVNDPFNPSESSLRVSPSPSNPFGDNSAVSPIIHRPEPHLAVPDASIYPQSDSRRSSLAPTESYQLYDLGVSGGMEDPYNADYENSDHVPLRNTTAQGNHLPYPDNANTGSGGGFMNRIRSTRRPGNNAFSNSQYSNIPPQISSMTPFSENDGEIPLTFNTGFRDLPDYSTSAYPQGNAYFPYPIQDSSFPGVQLSMPDPNALPQEDLIEESWNMRQQMEPANVENYTKKQVNLVNGIYSVEFPVPTPVKSAVEEKYLNLEAGSTEFTHMRYTACTCDPDEFKDQNYTLRAAEAGRRTELLIAVTYYSEDKVLTARTLTGIMKNIHHFCADKSEFWRNQNGEPWEKIVVTLIMDGIKPCRKDVLDVLASMGVYQDVMKNPINDKQTVAHIFEYTSQVCFTPDLEVITPSEGSSSKYTIPPIQYVLCIKQENSKKINSHRWLFNAFGSVLNPKVCVLIDAGTRPSSRAIVHLWRAFYNNQNVGGACGEIHAMLGKRGKDLLNPLIAAQNFEYKLSNQLDKPLEDTFGFISVLPGAFSAYRFEAIQGRPLEQYFRGDHSLADRLGDKGLNGMNIFKRNMFLAEDRILCFEITFKAKEKWHLKYVKASKAETDVPEVIDEFISQRRRWINGSFAATLYSMMHFGQIYRTGHNLLRTFFMHIQLFYNFINIIMTWFSLASYYLTTTIILELAANPNNEKESSTSSSSTDSTSTDSTSTDSTTTAAKFLARGIQVGLSNLFERDTTAKPFPFSNYRVSLSIALVIRFIYMLMIIISFLLALGNRPKGAKKQFTFLFIIFGIIQFYALIVAIYLCVNAFATSTDAFFTTASLYGNARLLVIIALVSTYGLYIYAGIIYLDPWHLIHSFIQYSFIMPSFTTVINVFAFCNWHDVSWGTKGADKADHLPAAKSETTEDGETEVVVTYERPQDDIDTNFLAVMKRAQEPYPKDNNDAKKKPDPDDESKTFRTNLIILWILCNVVLAAALTSQSVTSIGFSGTTSRSSVYFFILIVITAAMAGFRMIGCTIFVLKSAISRGFGKK